MSDKFNITVPNGYSFSIYYNNNDNKLDLLKCLLLDKWQDYCLKHWLWLHKFDPYKLNFEDKTKWFLDRCATFLLLDTEDFNKPTMKRKSKNKNTEVPLSSTSCILQDFVDSIDFPQEDFSINTYNYNIYNKILDMIDKKVVYIPKKYSKRDIRFNKLNKLFKRDRKIINDICILSNKEVFPYPPDLNGEELKKWGNRNAKNIVKQNILDVKPRIIEGHKGLIDRDKSYDWKWAVVDTEGIFEFRGKLYRISEDIKQYRPNFIYFRGDLKDIIYPMDKILCYFQDDKYYFFDQNVDRIGDGLITLV